MRVHERLQVRVQERLQVRVQERLLLRELAGLGLWAGGHGQEKLRTVAAGRSTCSCSPELLQAGGPAASASPVSEPSAVCAAPQTCNQWPAFVGQSCLLSSTMRPAAAHAHASLCARAPVLLCYCWCATAAHTASQAAHRARAQTCLSAQVEVRVPASQLCAADCRPLPLALELWAAGGLVASHSAVLLPSCSAGAHAELQALLQGGQGVGGRGEFVEDMAQWLQFWGAACAVPREELQWLQWPQDPGLAEGCGEGAGAATDEQLAAVMAELGAGLLEYSTQCSLGAISGEGLQKLPYGQGEPPAVGLTGLWLVAASQRAIHSI